MAKPFLLFPSFDFTLLFVYMSTTLKLSRFFHYGKCEILPAFSGGLCEIHA